MPSTVDACFDVMVPALKAHNISSTRSLTAPSISRSWAVCSPNGTNALALSSNPRFDNSPGSHPDASPLSGTLICQPVTAPLAKISRASRASSFCRTGLCPRPARTWQPWTRHFLSTGPLAGPDPRQRVSPSGLPPLRSRWPQRSAPFPAAGKEMAIRSTSNPRNIQHPWTHHPRLFNLGSQQSCPKRNH